MRYTTRMRFTRALKLLPIFVAFGSGGLVLAHQVSHAAAATNNTPERNFSLQISPSPLVATVEPGKPSSVSLTIRNGGTASENLKIEPRSFTISHDSQRVSIGDSAPTLISQWVSFSSSRFTVAPGQVQTVQVHFNLPKEAGFSYSFALLISRQSEGKPTTVGRYIKGSVADFTLINVNKPGATRKISVARLSTRHKLYEFLPANVDITLKNTGNSIVQPYGNVFINRGSSQLATLPVNDQRGYILPGTTRTVTTSWSSGFPIYRMVTMADGSQKRVLSWDWSNLSKLRIGKYTAKLVAVYNDGGRDVPLEGEVSFWVIPWRAIILLILVIAGLIYVQHLRINRKTAKAVKRALAAREPAKTPSDPPKSS